MWFQKLCVQWLQCGDHNTNFFHLSTMIRRRCNHIEALQLTDGSWVFDPLALKETTISYFIELYTSNPTTSREFIIMSFPMPIIWEVGGAK